jgi:uncharacterized protein YdiU (UPF0061 family)
MNDATALAPETAQLLPADRLLPGYTALPDRFYAWQAPEAVGVEPKLLHVSPATAGLLGIPPDADLAPLLSGHEGVNGARPFAAVYAGHQFGIFVPQLGDGRAITIATVRGADGSPYELQLKGAGRTPFSRFADGRAVMRSSIREYLCSEHMAALGIPTTRALALVATHEGVQRETLEPGAVVTRVAPSHVRFGHFEFFAHRGEPDAARQLADHVIAGFFADLQEAEDRYALFFDEVVRRTADLMAQWQSVGFAHGVMNTDNMSILGLTIDYGPFGFLDAYEPGFICNHSDHGGRYAFGNQPAIGLWNLQALGAALTSLVEVDRLRDGLTLYADRFEARFFGLMADKLGLSDGEANRTLLRELLTAMQAGQADYTNTFGGLSGLARGQAPGDWLAGFGAEAQPAIRPWLDRYQAALGAVDEERAARMDRVNPRVVLRNWVAETAIRAVEDEGDVETLDRVFDAVTNPFEAREDDPFAAPPPDHLKGLSVSCSS